MKKQLLLGSALVLSISAFSQKQKQLFESAKLVEDKRYLNSFTKANLDMYDTPTAANKPSAAVKETVSSNSNNATNATSSPILSSTFYRLSGSMNIFGMLVSASKPLAYNRIINTVTFTQRKSQTYVTSPSGDSNSGNIVVYLGKNDASTNNLSSWDSTLIWADAANLGRYPQGGIYNPPGNTDYNKAYVVGMGPVTSGSGWIGSWYASKSVTATPKNAPGADEQFFSNTPPFGSATSPSMPKHDFPRYGFSMPTNGNIYTAGSILNDINATTVLGQGARGAAVIKGSFNAGVMVWTADSLIPPTENRTDGSKLFQSNPYMTWNTAGTVGYVMFIGVRQGVAPGSSNRGYQPIVFKTTNSGTSWNLVNGIDFNANTPVINQIKNTMRSVDGYTTAPSTEAPWFWGEGIDVTVDKNDKLHIVATAIGHASSHVDSMNYLSRWTINGETYHWPHQNTARPLIVDYIGDGTSAWTPVVIDSLGSEGPSETSGEPGFGSNPWANQSQAQAVSSDSRIQITRSYDGEFLAYSWGESDTTVTTNQVKWNEFPNIKVRAYRTCDGSVSTDEYNITANAIARVKDKAYFHYMSSEMKAGSSTATSATMAIPFSVTNNTAYDGGAAVDNFFGMAHIQFAFPSSACGGSINTGIPASAKNEVTESRVFPNPAKNSVNVAISLSNANTVSVDVFNAIGQKINSMSVNGQVGENVINVGLNNATPGVYFVKVKSGSVESTKKLIIE